ncbi:Hypothetical predicted protein [Xyrichtys novacula]|uniref:Uncharacterized protein n=1 Tax=Xyrichtys novacula TaxID=13765 RepID=A0AAV1FE45_XYRNO|nr:Hypothetical predicted protein [Xyrichtys novacula]
MDQIFMDMLSPDFDSVFHGHMREVSSWRGGQETGRPLCRGQDDLSEEDRRQDVLSEEDRRQDNLSEEDRRQDILSEEDRRQDDLSEEDRTSSLKRTGRPLSRGQETGQSCSGTFQHHQNLKETKIRDQFFQHAPEEEQEEEEEEEQEEEEKEEEE